MVMARMRVVVVGLEGSKRRDIQVVESGRLGNEWKIGGKQQTKMFLMCSPPSELENAERWIDGER